MDDRRGQWQVCLHVHSLDHYATWVCLKTQEPAKWVSIRFPFTATPKVVPPKRHTHVWSLSFSSKINDWFAIFRRTNFLRGYIYVNAAGPTVLEVSVDRFLFWGTTQSPVMMVTLSVVRLLLCRSDSLTGPESGPGEDPKSNPANGNMN